MLTSKTFKFLSVAAVIGAAAAFSAPQASAQEVKLRLHTFVPAPSGSFKALVWWAKQVEEKSNKRISIKLFPSRQLGGKPSELYDQARRGFVDITYVLPGYSPGRFPRSEVAELPFISGRPPTVMSPAVWTLYQSHLKEEYKDTHPLLVFSAGSMGLFSHKPIKSVEDLKGLKVRVSGRALTDTFKVVGATPVGIPGTGFAEAFQRNVIDTVLTAWTISLPTKLVRMASHYAQPAISNPVLMLVMNKDSYEKMPSDLKRVIDGESGMGLAHKFGARWLKDDGPALNVANKSGKPFYNFSEADRKKWETAAAPVFTSWVARMKEKGIDGQELIDAARAAVAKFEK